MFLLQAAVLQVLLLVLVPQAVVLLVLLLVPQAALPLRALVGVLASVLQEVAWALMARLLFSFSNLLQKNRRRVQVLLYLL
jgi:hypothetical protein